MLAYYLDKLRSTPDGDGSLLDHSMILYGAALSDANLHLYTDLPLLLVAGGVDGIKGGQHVKYPKRTPMTNLLLTMLDKANVPVWRSWATARSGWNCRPDVDRIREGSPRKRGPASFLQAQAVSCRAIA